MMSEERLRKPVSAKKTVSRVLLYLVVIDICLLILYPYFVICKYINKNIIRDEICQ